ncbi:MAG TPA: hypothetical protein VIQ62_00695 [Burkholderiales bacterium]
MITDVLATADDTHDVYALLVAYFEAVRAHDSGLTLPESLTRLPVRSAHEIACRYADARELYARCAGETGHHDVLLAEITDVTGAALHRLHVLEELLEHAT